MYDSKIGPKRPLELCMMIAINVVINTCYVIIFMKYDNQFKDRKI